MSPTLKVLIIKEHSLFHDLPDLCIGQDIGPDTQVSHEEVPIDCLIV